MNHRWYISNHRQGSVNPLDPTTKKGTDETPRNSKNQWRITHGKSPLPWIFDGFWLFVHGKHRSTMVYFPSQALQGHMMIVIFATDVTAEPEDRQGTICRLWDDDIFGSTNQRDDVWKRYYIRKKKRTTKISLICSMQPYISIQQMMQSCRCANWWLDAGREWPLCNGKISSRKGIKRLYGLLKIWKG